MLKDLSSWFWRLVPANPILVRVVSAGGRRLPHLWIRIGYLTIIAVAVVIGVIITQNQGSSLAELAKSATSVFKWVSIMQLAMVCVLAPVFAAAAITQEKDSQTYNILLSTPLTNGQIVLGSLLSRLYFVFVLLFAGLPLFCIMMVYGGVTFDKIVQSLAIAGATALLTGSLAITISVVKIGTGRTIFSFYLAIAVYLIVVYFLGRMAMFMPPEAVAAPASPPDLRMSWLAPIHPFLSLGVILGETPAPDYGAVMHYGFPGKYLLAFPHYSYMALTVIISTSLIVLSLFFVRRSVKEGEVTWFSRLFGRVAGGAGSRTAADADDDDDGDSRRRKPRKVKRNPITWRESVTGSAAGGAMGRYLIVFVGALLGLILVIMHMAGSFDVSSARMWLKGVVAVEMLIALFVATTTAATSMTREKESNTLELVLATPLTSKKIITGKIWGLVYAAGPMLLVPYGTVLLFLLWDLVKLLFWDDPGVPVVNWEVALTLPVLLLAFTAFSCMIGLKSSINSRKTITAVFSSMGWVILIFMLTTGCGMMMVRGSTGNEVFASAFMPLSPVYSIFAAIDPEHALTDGLSKVSADSLQTCRMVGFIATFCVAGLYLLVGHALHGQMVKTFDMTIRKQTA